MITTAPPLSAGLMMISELAFSSSSAVHSLEDKLLCLLLVGVENWVQVLLASIYASSRGFLFLGGVQVLLPLNVGMSLSVSSGSSVWKWSIKPRCLWKFSISS